MTMLGAEIKAMENERRRPIDLLALIESEYECDIVLFNAPIDEDGYGRLVQASTGIPREHGILLVLVTTGGYANSAYKIARYCQAYFREFIVSVPGICKSAGTLITLGASRILMSPFSELGPLDVQLLKPDELFERRSGLLSKSAIRSLTEQAFDMFEYIMLHVKARSGGVVAFKTASQIAGSITNGLLGPVFSAIDPISMEQDNQDLRVAEEYGKRLIAKYGVIDHGTVSKLVEMYPSHDFVIDYPEARELLGNVEMASTDLLSLQALLGARAQLPQDRQRVVQSLQSLLGESEPKNETIAGDNKRGGGTEGHPGSDDETHRPSNEETGPRKRRGCISPDGSPEREERRGVEARQDSKS